MSAVTYVPFLLSQSNYRLVLPVGDRSYLFDVRWNSRDAAHYLDIREQDETAVALGLKLVLGVNLGRKGTNPFFIGRVLRVYDSEQQGLDAAFDDLGRRVNLAIIDAMELFRAHNVDQTL